MWGGYGGGEPLAGGDFTSEQLDFGLFVALRDRGAICGAAQVALSGGLPRVGHGHRRDDPLRPSLAGSLVASDGAIGAGSLAVAEGPDIDIMQRGQRAHA
ncbi:MAG: hypothetical protein M3O70_06865 [Actinomycetota bacterium]|nr:hypothetical protein [Actinomycetota bacterium]